MIHRVVHSRLRPNYNNKMDQIMALNVDLKRELT